MSSFWDTVLQVLQSQGRRKRLNLALIVPLVIFVFTILAWEHYVTSDLFYNRIIISNLIILLGLLFSTSVGVLIWSLERNFNYAQSSRTFFDNIIKSTVAPLMVIDLKSRVKTVNQAALKLLGYREEEILGQRIEKIMCENDSFQDLTGELLEKGFLNPFECQLKTRDGEPVPVLFSASVVKDEFENRLGIVCVAQDISERKELEQKLFRARQLEFVGRLASGVAHDFNNLLSGMAGLSEFLLMDLDETNPLRKDAEQINQLAISGSNLTKQLLAFSRRKMTHPEIVDLNESILRLTNVMRKILGEDIEVVTLPDPELGKIYADPGQLEQVLLNLITNARDAMPQGGKIIIKTENVIGEKVQGLKKSEGDGAAANYILVQVQDTGHGMSEEVQKRIFEPFFTTKEEGKGVGLGLATAHEIIENAGGLFTVQSKVGQGTMFQIYLPQTDRKTSDIPGKPEMVKSFEGRERVLLVEDEALVRSVAARALRRQGYQVIEASNGSEALHWAEKNVAQAPDLLMADLVMPQIGGKELARQLLKLHPKMKVLFTSGYVGNAQNLGDDLAEHAGFLQKPFSPTTLGQKVRDVLDSGN